jgi:hypothetical protein
MPSIPTGVYEVWWQANARYPDWPLSGRLRAAEQAVAKLVCDGLVTLGRGDYQDAADHPIPLAETADVLRDWATWVIPQGPDVYMLATDEGIAAICPGRQRSRRALLSRATGRRFRARCSA